MKTTMKLTPPPDAAADEGEGTTLRRELWDAGFREGVVALGVNNMDVPCREGFCADPPRCLNDDDDVLDAVFEDGFGSPEAPSIVAEDADWIYLFDQYDGLDCMFRVAKDIGVYLSGAEKPPRPGG